MRFCGQKFNNRTFWWPNVFKREGIGGRMCLKGKTVIRLLLECDWEVNETALLPLIHARMRRVDREESCGVVPVAAY